MRKRLWYAAGLLLAFLAGSVMTSHVQAQWQSPEEWSRIATHKIPLEWGPLKAATDKTLIFEDAQGTLRTAPLSGNRYYYQIERVPAQSR